jgi:hypothetical protein
MSKLLAGLTITTLALAGLAAGAPQKDTYTLTANLRARSEVPKPTGVPRGATGLFTGKAVELQNDRARFTWRLTLSKLSGRALQAHVHVGRAGKAGNVMLALCAPCRTGQRGTATITHAQLRTIRAGNAYVNVHTAKNAAGEVRGQLKASEVGSSSNDPPAPDPSPTPNPPPYP